MTVNDEQWSKIDEKYCRLLWKISHNISGDDAIATPEDNYADLQVAALEAVAGFEKKTGRKFDEFWGEKLFDQYFKTCLWNFKNNKGARIAKRYHLYRDSVPLCNDNKLKEIEIRHEEAQQLENNVFFEDIGYILNKQQKDILNVLVQDPGLIKESGKVNIRKLAKEMGTTWYHMDKIIKEISRIVANRL